MRSIQKGFAMADVHAFACYTGEHDDITCLLLHMELQRPIDRLLFFQPDGQVLAPNLHQVSSTSRGLRQLFLTT